MSTRVDPDLILELKKYGEVKIESCFNCGNCTAICPLTTDEHPFPRNMLRYVQLGMKDQMLETVDPWLCYYCGECSETCPRGAEPAEAMMTIRRWLTAQYDKSGKGAKLYTSSKALWRAIIQYSLVPLVLLLIYHGLTALGFEGFGKIVTDRVALNTFAPAIWVWVVVLIDFAILAIRLFTNIGRMHNMVMGREKTGLKIPLQVYVKEGKTFIENLLTQKRWRDCSDDTSRWFKHLILVSGYFTMLVLIVGMLWWFQTDNIYPIWHPQRWVGYLATIALLYGSGEALIGRMRKKEELHRFSHESDWLFPAFIFVGAITGILVNIFRYMGLPWPTYIIYTIHVMVMVAMLDSEVGIGKWTHLFYRPLAIYFEAVKKRAAQEETTMAPAPAGMD